MKELIERLALQYDLPIDFLTNLEARIVDKENFARAVKMFHKGVLPFAVATGNEPINVEAIRHDLVVKRLAWRKEQVKIAKEQKRVNAFYDGCDKLVLGEPPTYEVVFIKDGAIVAFANYQPQHGGVYMADNEVHPNMRWHPDKALKRLAKMDKDFIAKVRAAAPSSPGKWFDL